MVKKINKKQSYKNIKCLVFLTNELVHERIHTFLPTLFQVIYIDKVIIQREVSRLTDIRQRYQLIETAYKN